MFIFKEENPRFETTLEYQPASRNRASNPLRSIPALACFFCCCLNFRRIRFSAYLFRGREEHEKNGVKGDTHHAQGAGEREKTELEVFRGKWGREYPIREKEGKGSGGKRGARELTLQGRWENACPQDGTTLFLEVDMNTNTTRVSRVNLVSQRLGLTRKP